MNKKTEEIIEDKQIAEIGRYKRLFTTKSDEIKVLKTKLIELKYIKHEEKSIDAWEKQLVKKLEMLKDKLVMLE